MVKLLNNKRMRLIKQKLSSDCGICCLAMLTGIQHKKVIKLIGDCWNNEEGLGGLSESLIRLGFKTKKVKIKFSSGKTYNIEQPINFKVIRYRDEISHSYFTNQVWGRRALLTVPSLNYKNGYHLVYWHYNKLYDPSTKKIYKNLDELKPTQIAIFMENQ